MDISPILRQGRKASPVSPLKRGTAPRSSQNDDDDGQEEPKGRLYAPLKALPSSRTYSRTDLKGSSPLLDDSDDDEDFPLASTRILPRQSKVGAVATPCTSASSEADTSTQVMLPPFQRRTGTPSGGSAKMNSKVFTSAEVISTRLVQATFERAAGSKRAQLNTKHNSDWGSDSPLSSPPSSTASSPRNTGESFGHRRVRAEDAPASTPQDFSLAKQQIVPNVVSADEYLFIERPTRSRTRALANVLLPHLAENARGLHGAPLQNVSASGPRKRKAAELIAPPPSGTELGERNRRAAKRPRTSGQNTLDDSPPSDNFEEQAEVQQSSHTSAEDSTSDVAEPRDLGNRTFPPSTQISSSFSLFYRRFPVLENKPRFVYSLFIC